MVSSHRFEELENYDVFNDIEPIKRRYHYLNNNETENKIQQTNSNSNQKRSNKYRKYAKN
ncbi:MAG: hypothetical protein MJ089_05990 [Ruminococcus sp.]|nr:hypothetical protein [Ruminococcus sp.]